MSKQQVEWDYQKLLWERRDRIIKDTPKGFIKRFIWNNTAHYYPMPLRPIDDDFRVVKKKG